MKREVVFLTVCGLMISAWFPGVGFSTTFTEEGVKGRGVIFNVADDRKIDYVNGYQEPEPIDKYLKRKFEDVYAQLKVVNEKLDKISASLEALSKSEKKL